MTQILIIIEGGNLQNVITDDPHLRVVVIDRDDDALDPVRVHNPWPIDQDIVSSAYFDIIVAQAEVEEAESPYPEYEDKLNKHTKDLGKAISDIAT